MRIARTLTGLLLAGIATAALGWGSRVPYTPPGANDAVLRLSWRLRGEKLQSCRERSPAELDALPVHMRTPQVCTGQLVAYRMTLRVNGVITDTMTFLPGGAKGDRPIFVLHDEPLAAGEHRVQVDFVPEEHSGGSAPKALHYDCRITARAGRVQMITLAPDGSRLVLVE